MKSRKIAQVIFLERLVTLLKEGYSMDEALNSQTGNEELNATQQTIMSEIASNVSQGTPLSSSLENHPEFISDEYIRIIRIGEKAKQEINILERVSEFIERDNKLYRKIKSHLIYSSIVLTIILAITSGMLLSIVPKFKVIYDELLEGESLPAITENVLKASSVLQVVWPVVALLIILFIAIAVFLTIPCLTKWLHCNLLNLPIYPHVILGKRVVRLSSVLGTLMKAGIEEKTFFKLIDDSDPKVTNALKGICDMISSKDMTHLNEFFRRRSLVSRVCDKMLKTIAKCTTKAEFLCLLDEKYNNKFEERLKSIFDWFEPIMIILFAIILVSIFAALFMPLLSSPIHKFPRR